MPFFQGPFFPLLPFFVLCVCVWVGGLFFFWGGPSFGPFFCAPFFPIFPLFFWGGGPSCGPFCFGGLFLLLSPFLEPFFWGGPFWGLFFVCPFCVFGALSVFGFFVVIFLAFSFFGAFFWCPSLGGCLFFRGLLFVYCLYVGATRARWIFPRQGTKKRSMTTGSWQQLLTLWVTKTKVERHSWATDCNPKRPWDQTPEKAPRPDTQLHTQLHKRIPRAFECPV